MTRSYQPEKGLMGTRNQSQAGTYRINLKLDPHDDADIITWLESCPNGHRSIAVREAIRRGLGMTPPPEANLNLEAIRRVIADELTKALASQPIASQLVNKLPTANSVEAKYGAKLNKLLGGLTTSHSDPKAR